MVSENFPNIKIGSKVFVYCCGVLAEHEIKDIYILNRKGELICEVLTVISGGTSQNMPLRLFIEGIEKAQNMKISDIYR